MRSIRLSLMLYFLGLLTLALGAVSPLVYHTVYQTLRVKQEAVAQLVNQRYEERCEEAKRQFDEALMAQAQNLARLVQVQWNGFRRHQELLALEELSAGLAPTGPLLTCFWARNGGVGMFPPNLYRGELKFDEEALNPHVDGQVAEYVQINSIWGDYRSPSLVNAGLSLPFDPSVVSPDQPFSWKFDELQPEPGLRVRRVMLKV